MSPGTEELLQFFHFFQGLESDHKCVKFVILVRFHPHHRGRVQHLHAGGSPESPAEYYRRVPVPGQLCGQEYGGEGCNACALNQ